MKLKSHLTLLGVISLVSPAAHAAVFAGTFDFSGTTANVASFSYNGTAINNLTVGNLAKVGVTTSSSSGNSRASGWSTGATTGSDTFLGTVDLGKYFEFTLSVDSGFTLDMSSISFGLGRSATGPRQWQWRSNVDSYAATIGSYTSTNSSLTNSGGVLTNPDTNSSWTGNILDLSGSSFQDLSSITFRLYGFNSEATTGTGGLQGNLTFSGDVVPEPSGAAILGSIGILGLLRRRR